MKSEGKNISIEEVRGYRLYNEGQSPTYPGTRDYILTGVRGSETFIESKLRERV